jgi:N-methylhydantoinase A
VEIMSFAVTVATETNAVAPVADESPARAETPAGMRAVRDSVTAEISEWAMFDRATLAPGSALRGPAIIAEDETSTLVGPGWSARINARGYIELMREAQG